MKHAKKVEYRTPLYAIFKKVIPETDLEKKKAVQESGIANIYLGRNPKETAHNSEKRRQHLISQRKQTEKLSINPVQKHLNFIEKKLEEKLEIAQEEMKKIDNKRQFVHKIFEK